MDNPPPLAVTIAAVVVEHGPGLVILSTGSIARLIHRALSLRRDIAPEHGPLSWNAETLWRGGWAGLTRTDGLRSPRLILDRCRGRRSIRVRDGSLTAPEHPAAWCGWRTGDG